MCEARTTYGPEAIGVPCLGLSADPPFLRWRKGSADWGEGITGSQNIVRGSRRGCRCPVVGSAAGDKVSLAIGMTGLATELLELRAPG